LPLAAPDNTAIVHEYRSKQRLVYIHDLDLDGRGRPVILYITSADHRPGPAGDPRWWTVAHWLGDRWQCQEVTRANHNYSTGSLRLESHEAWRIIGPTECGPQPIGSGGEVAIWTSQDAGQTWRKERDVTRGSALNHNYVRRVINAHPDFYAFWADGHARQPSDSRLYFCDKAGAVRRLPPQMKEESEKPLSTD